MLLFMSNKEFELELELDKNCQLARAYCACNGCGWGLFGHFFLSSIVSLFFLPLWETARYRLKYCLKGPLNPRQPTSLRRFIVRFMSEISFYGDTSADNFQYSYPHSNSLLHIFRGGRVVRWCWVNFQCRGVLLIWIIVGQGLTVLSVGAGGGSLVIFFSLLYHFSSFSLSLGDGPI